MYTRSWLINWELQADEFRPERMLDGKFEALPVRCLPKTRTFDEEH
jgi:hypothetical protein